MTSDGHTARAELAALLKDLDDAAAERDAAAARVSVIADAVSDRVILAAGESIGSRASVTLARRLYWDYPQVPVAAIATLLGVAETRVSPVVGSLTVELRCRLCGRSFAWEKPSRHALAITSCPRCRQEPVTDIEQMSGWQRTPAV